MRKLKSLHASATHIMCGYRLFGIKHHELQDYSDDGETYGGRAVLEPAKSYESF